MRKHHPSGNAAALSRYADQILGPVDAPPMFDAELDPELAATVRRLGAFGRQPAPIGARERVWSRIQPPAWSAVSVRIGSQEGQRMNAIPIPMASSPDSVWRRSIAPPRAAYPLFALVLLLLGLTAYLGFSRWNDDGPERAIPAAQVSTPTAEQQAATEPTASVQFNVAPQVAGCTTAPREPGRVEALFETKTNSMGLFPRPSGDVFHLGALLDGDAYVERFTSGPADEATIESINQTLAQLSACRYHAWTSDGTSNADGPYFANFSDDYFSLLFSSRAYEGASRDFRPRILPSRTFVPVVEQAWVTTFATDGRVMATVLTGRESGNARTAMVFVPVGDRWLIEEVAESLIFDAPPALPEFPKESVETWEIAIYDADAPRAPGVNGNYWDFGLYAFDYPFLADGGLLIRLVNLGSQPHAFKIPELDISQTLEPGEVVDLPIDAPVGTYEWAIYEGLNPEPTATRTFELVPPGTQRGGG